MLRLFTLNKSVLLGLALLAAAPALSPAFAQGRGRGGDHHDNGGGNKGGNRGGNDHRNDNRGPGNNRPNTNWNNNRAPVVRYDNHNDNWNNNRGGWDNRNSRDRNWNRNNYNWAWNDNYRRYDRSHTSLSLGFIFGSPGYGYGYGPYDGYGYDGYREPIYYNSWGLAPGQCIWNREFAYWRGRPADVEVRRCADGYGNVYVVANSARLWRYR